jgi:hypothetical protein
MSCLAINTTSKTPPPAQNTAYPLKAKYLTAQHYKKNFPTYAMKAEQSSNLINTNTADAISHALIYAK